MSEATQHSCTSSPTRRSKIVETAEKYIGTRFRHQGRNPEVGLDCLGLVVLCARAAGYDPPDERTYNPAVTGHDLRATLNKYCKKKPRTEMIAGDILLMTMGREIFPKHLGIFTGTHVIHATMRRKKVVIDPIAHQIDNVVAVYELPEVDANV